MSKHRAPIQLSRDPQAISEVDKKEQANTERDKINSQVATYEG